MREIEVTPTITTSAYTSGDVVGGKLEFVGSAKKAMLNKLTIIDQDGENAPFDLILFKRDFTSASDNAAFAITGGEELRVMAHIEVLASDYRTLDGTVTMAQVDIGDLVYELDASNNSQGYIYGNLVIRAAHTYTATDDLTIRLGVLDRGAH